MSSRQRWWDARFEQAVCVVVVGLGFAGWLGIVKGAVGVAREEGPCSLQILLSKCSGAVCDFREDRAGNRAIDKPVAEGIASKKGLC